MTENERAGLIRKGDIVRCVKVYPHHVMVETLKTWNNGKRKRQCFALNGIGNDLEVYKK